MTNLRVVPDGINWDYLTAEDLSILQRVIGELEEQETSELATGKLLVEARAVCEKYKIFARFLKKLPFTERTAYRRIRAYERAVQMWGEQGVDRAIVRKTPMVGVTAQKPMGLYEDLPFTADGEDVHPDSVELAEPTRPFEEQIEDYLITAELEVHRRAKGKTKKRSRHDLLKKCFRAMEQSARDISTGDREVFLADLVALAMTLFVGAKNEQKFTPAPIPQDFWMRSLGGYERTPKIRKRISAAAKERWRELDTAKRRKLKKRA